VRDDVITAFQGADDEVRHLHLPDAQLTREPIIDRKTMRLTSDYVYQVLPPIEPLDLIERDFDRLLHGPYALNVDDILQYLQSISSALQSNWEMVERIRDYARPTSLHPEIFLDSSFATLGASLDPQTALSTIDHELSIWEIPGSKFLDEWVEIPSSIFPGLVPLIASGLVDSTAPSPPECAMTLVHAMPTRQLHITAGNAPQIALISALRIILTKSAGVVKSPLEAILPGALLSIAANVVARDHPFTQNLSIVYWPGGDENIEAPLFMPNAFDRIVVWGSPEAVSSVQTRATFTKTIAFNPRYGISMIGREAFTKDLRDVAFKAVMDTMIYNQKACASSQVHYLEASDEQITAYSDHLLEILSQWDDLAPQFIHPSKLGQIKRMKRGKYTRANWRINIDDGSFKSGLAILPDEFNLLDHPMCRLVIIRKVDDLNEVLGYLHQGVSTVGVFPEERRIALRDSIAARGVSNVLPLGQCERLFPGAPHDGMMVLNQLVDWKNG
jgi:hypothetical protein